MLTNITLRHTVSCNCFNAYYRVLLMEAYGTLDQVMDYYGTPKAPGGHFSFNFRLITDIHYGTKHISSAEEISRNINEYLARMTDGRTPNWVVRTCSVPRSVLFRRHDNRGHWSYDPYSTWHGGGVIKRQLIWFVLSWQAARYGRWVTPSYGWLSGYIICEMQVKKWMALILLGMTGWYTA